MQTLWKDLRCALRILAKSPGFATVATLTLALGIGANAAIFQLIDAVRLRTLPVQDPGTLAIVHLNKNSWGSGNFTGPYSELRFRSGRKSRSGSKLFRRSLRGVALN